MKSSIITTTADSISSGGTITGDLTISGDLTVTGGGGFHYTEVISASDSGASYTQYVNSTTGTGSGDGTLIGLGATEETVIWNQENTQMVFATNNAERMRITSGGAVGINETVPLGTLHVKSADSGISTLDGSGDELVIEGSGHAGISILAGASSSAGIYFPDSSDANRGFVRYYHDTDSMKFRTNNADAVTIDSSGNVGIGTSDPTSDLDIGASGGGDLTLSRTGDSNITDGSNLGVIYFKGHDDSGSNVQPATGAKIVGQSAGHWDQDDVDDAPTELQFWTCNASGGTSIAQRMVIDADGNVGIGTSSPATKMHIQEDSAVAALYIDHNENHNAISIDAENTTSYSVYVESDALTTGKMLYLKSNSSSTGTRNLVEIHNDHASATGTTGLKILQDSTGYALNAVSAADADVTVANFQSAIDANGEHSIIRVGHSSKAAYMGLLLNSADTAYFGIDDNPDDGNGIYVNESGHTGIGTKAPEQQLSVAATSGGGHPRIGILNHVGDSEGGTLYFRKSRNTTVGSHTVVQDGDEIGVINFSGSDGNSFEAFAAIKCKVDGTPGNSDTPGRLEFYTVDNGTNTLGDPRMVIKENGNVGIGVTPQTWNSAMSAVQIGGNGAIEATTSAGASGELKILQNAYHSGSAWTKISDDEASEYIQAGGVHTFGSAATGTGTFTFTSVAKFDINSRISLSNNDAGTQNTVFGHSAGLNIDAGTNYNTFIGYVSAGGATLDDATNNTAVGYATLNALTQGDNNIALGTNALLSLSTGGSNTVIGVNAGDAITTTSDCVLIGRNAGTAINHNNANGTTIVGRDAGESLTSGIGNTALGYAAMNALTTAGYSTFIGHNAGLVHTTGGYNMAIGYGAMDDTNAGNNSLGSTENIFIGVDSGGGTWADTASSYNVAIGNYTMDAALDGANYNVAIGRHSLGALTTGDNNVALGASAGVAVTSGGGNVIIGQAAGSATTDVDNAVIIGRDAGGANLTSAADGTVAVGYAAGNAITSGAGNTAVGYQCLDATDDGGLNTAVGYQSLSANCGNGNVAVGYRAGYGVTGALNILIGHQAGHDTVQLTSGTQNIVIGDNARTSAADSTNQVVIGRDAQGVGDNSVTLGNASILNVYAGSDGGAHVHCSGVSFPATQSASGGANVQDDYEEGEHTATVTGTTSGNFVVNSTNDIFRYTKIGRLVHVQGLLSIDSDNSSSGTIRVSLPFTSGNATGLGARSYGSCVLYNHGGTIDGTVMVSIEEGEAFFTLVEIEDNGDRNYLDESDVDGAWAVAVDVTYTV